MGTNAGQAAGVLLAAAFALTLAGCWAEVRLFERDAEDGSVNLVKLGVGCSDGDERTVYRGEDGRTYTWTPGPEIPPEEKERLLELYGDGFK